jgi:hypothetical protein
VLNLVEIVDSMKHNYKPIHTEMFEYVDLKLNRLKNPLIEIIWVETFLMVISKKNWFKLYWENDESRQMSFFTRSESILDLNQEESISAVHMDMDLNFLYLIIK